MEEVKVVQETAKVTKETDLEYMKVVLESVKVKEPDEVHVKIETNQETDREAEMTTAAKQVEL